MEMKNDLINEGPEATNKKLEAMVEIYKERSNTKTIIILFMFVFFAFGSCNYVCELTNRVKALDKIEAQNEVIAIQKATINELTHDNMNLVNNTK